MNMRRFFLPICILLGACLPGGPAQDITRGDVHLLDRSSSGALSYNPFPEKRGIAKAFSNQDLVRDFVDLNFQLENGTALPRFTRFEGPISVSIATPAPPSLASDLTRLIARLRSEANLDIFYSKSKTANIMVHAVPTRTIHSVIPNAACFVAPNVTSLSEYRMKRGTKAVSWSGLTARQTMSVFVPSDGAPQNVRDCLHEEFSQALGPLNDLYRLNYSIYNDDNVHTVLTSFDMMILKAAYDPALRSGMSRSEVLAKLPSIFARINPRGQSISPKNMANTPLAWKVNVQKAMSGGFAADRMTAAQAAVDIARRAGWNDHRLGFSYFALARILQNSNFAQAEKLYHLADSAFRMNGTYTSLHSAYVAGQIASFYLARGQASDALVLLSPAIATAQSYENAALLSTLMLLQAEALDMTGQHGRARAVRLDSTVWARYGFGSTENLYDRFRDIHALNPIKRNNG